MEEYDKVSSIFYFRFLVVSSKMLLQRPIAGSQVPFCPLEKKVPDSWSRVEPGSFKVRGPTYLRLENCSNITFRIFNPDISLNSL